MLGEGMRERLEEGDTDVRIQEVALVDDHQVVGGSSQRVQHCDDRRKTWGRDDESNVVVRVTVSPRPTKFLFLNF